MSEHTQDMNVVNLGIQRMPEGYELILNNDCTHYYWIRSDGMESCIHWDKWAVYRGAKADFADPCGGLTRGSEWI